MTTPTTNSDPKELTMTTPTPMPWTWTTNADGSLVCPHRDLSVCPSCAELPQVVEAAGAHFLADVCPCGTPDDANGHHVCPDLPSEEVHRTSEGLATVTIHQHGQVLGIGHGFTLSDARAQAQERARAAQVVAEPPRCQGELDVTDYDGTSLSVECPNPATHRVTIRETFNPEPPHHPYDDELVLCDRCTDAALDQDRVVASSVLATEARTTG